SLRRPEPQRGHPASAGREGSRRLAPRPRVRRLRRPTPAPRPVTAAVAWAGRRTAAVKAGSPCRTLRLPELIPPPPAPPVNHALRVSRSGSSGRRAGGGCLAAWCCGAELTWVSEASPRGHLAVITYAAAW